MTSAQLDAFEALLEEPDQDIYDWYLGRAEPPAHVDAAMLAMVRSFDPSTGAIRG